MFALVRHARMGVRRLHQRVWPKRVSIAYKLALIFTLLATASMVLLGVLLARDQTRVLGQQIREFGDTLVSQVAESAKDPLLANDSLALEVIVNNLVAQPRVLGAAIYTEDMTVQAGAGAVPTPEAARAALAKGKELRWGPAAGPETAEDLVSYHSRIVFRGVTVGYALVTFDHSLMRQAVDHTIQTVISAIILLLILTAGASVYVGKRLTRPIYRLMHASRAISAGDYGFRLKEQRNDELGLLMQSLNAMGEGLLRKEQVEHAFSRYVSPNVARAVLNDLERVCLGGRHVQASVLFADIVGFTALSETMNPSDVSELLNEYFTHIAKAAEVFHGHVDKYIGDCVMLVFGVPEEDLQHCFHATACAVLIQQLVGWLNQRRKAGGQTPIRFRIGVNSGTMLAGNMGSEDRMNYTVVGDAVNLASRLSAIAGPEQIIITANMYEDLRASRLVKCEKHGTMALRGRREPVATFRVVEVGKLHRAMIAGHFAQITGSEVEKA